VFEAMAFLSTVALVVTVVVLYHADRKARQEEERERTSRG
jgi:hypothetical protein